MSSETEKRHQTILKMLMEEPYLTITHIARRLDLSEPTIRRDIRMLSEQGRVTRVRGGAFLSSSIPTESPFLSRYEFQGPEKQKIAQAAVNLIRPRSVVAVDIGTTTLYLAEQMKDMAITVVTNNVRAAMQLTTGSADVILTGGRIQTGELSVTGSYGLRSIRSFQFDIFFMSVAGINESGFLDINMDEIDMKQEMRIRSSKTVVLADHTKFVQPSGLMVCGFSDVDLIITDRLVSHDLTKKIQASGTEVLICEELCRGGKQLG